MQIACLQPRLSPLHSVEGEEQSVSGLTAFATAIPLPSHIGWPPVANSQMNLIKK